MKAPDPVPMSLSRRILASKAGRDYVKPGELCSCSLDLAMGNDITVPPALNLFGKYFPDGKLYSDCRYVFCMDHFTPCKDIRSAQNVKQCRDFAKSHSEIDFFDVGTVGIEHCFLPENGYISPFDCIIGADSHTCTYGALGAFSTGVGSTDLAVALRSGKCWFRIPEAIGFRLTGKLPEDCSGKDLILYIIGMIGVDGALYKSMEFFGEGVSSLSIDDRFTVCNMAVEAGAKNGIFIVDPVAEQYLAEAGASACNTGALSSGSVDENAYERIIDINLSDLVPMVALPHKPSNTKPVMALDRIEIDQVVIGSCTNGRITDLRIAADILRGKKVAPYVRCIIIPGTQKIYMQALEEGLIETFISAGAAVSTPTCGPCLGGHTGVLADNERCVSTTNRNFVGRMGHITSEVYLASPRTAALAAVNGYIGS